jgi:integrase
MEMAARNPFAAARKPSAPPRKVTPPDAAQVARLLATDGQFGLFVRVAATIGARRGEVVALQWADVEGSAIIIRRSLAYSPTSGVVVTEGKTGAKGHRVVAVDAGLAADLRTERARQAALSLEAGDGAPVWIFTHDAGATPWRPDYPSRRFRLLCRTLGLTGVRLHDLRHFVATQLLASGIPVKVVSERLGHRQVATTADRYGAYVPAADVTAAETMARILGVR